MAPWYRDRCGFNNIPNYIINMGGVKASELNSNSLRTFFTKPEVQIQDWNVPTVNFERICAFDFEITGRRCHRDKFLRAVFEHPDSMTKVCVNV